MKILEMTELLHIKKCRACLNSEDVPLMYLFQAYYGHNQTLASILQICINKEVCKTSIAFHPILRISIKQLLVKLHFVINFITTPDTTFTITVTMVI